MWKGEQVVNKGVVYTGIPSEEELAVCPGVPSYERTKKGRVAVIECVQEIPCNPCENACQFGAITIGEQITSLPSLNEEKCTGCGLCVPGCPGLAITIVDRSLDDGQALIEFPFEYLPLPKKGDKVIAVNRAGQPVCEGEVMKIKDGWIFGGTVIVGIKIPEEYANEVRSMQRLKGGEING